MYDTLNGIEDISVVALEQRGIKVIFLDADNTLCIPNKKLQEQDTTQMLAFLTRLQQAHLKIVIISNNFAADKRDLFLKLGIPARFFALKPLPFSFYLAHKQIERIHQIKYQKKEILHIGDQVLTDMLGARCYGIQSILVQPLQKDQDLIFAQPSRLIEKIIEYLKK